jgi:hypothetical protein
MCLALVELDSTIKLAGYEVSSSHVIVTWIQVLRNFDLPHTLLSPAQAKQESGIFAMSDEIARLKLNGA